MNFYVVVLCQTLTFSNCSFSFQQELGEAVAHATRRFKERYPEKSIEWTTGKLHEAIGKAVDKVKKETQSELKKQLPIADPKLTPQFLEEVKKHYECREDDPEMSQEKLWYLATSSMDNSMKVKWLERWNKPASLREAVKFPKSKFADHAFPEWLHKATWWGQVGFVQPACS